MCIRDRNYTVVGVMPPGFRVMDSPADVWIPLGIDPADTRINHSRFFIVIAAMRPGIAVSQVRAEMDALGDRLEQADPILNRGWRPSVFPLREELSGSVEKPLEVLMSAVGLLLLMACANAVSYTHLDVYKRQGEQGFRDGRSGEIGRASCRERV